MATRPSVLLVDDDVAIREALAEVLVDEGFAVHQAVNGREALDWLHHDGSNGSRPCVVLLDLMMPVMDGTDASWRPGTPIRRWRRSPSS